PVERQFGNADLANGIRHRHALAAQNLNLPKLRDDLVGLVSLVCHCGPPSWSKPYFKVDPFNGGGSLIAMTSHRAGYQLRTHHILVDGCSYWSRGRRNGKNAIASSGGRPSPWKNSTVASGSA